MNSVTDASVLEQIDIYKQQERITMSQPINALSPASPSESEDSWSFFLYEGSLYVWEFYGLFVRELIGTIVGGVIVVTLVGFLFIPHWTATVFLLPIISVLCVDMIGKLMNIYGTIVAWKEARFPVSYLCVQSHHRFPPPLRRCLEWNELLLHRYEHRFTCGFQHAYFIALL